MQSEHEVEYIRDISVLHPAEYNPRSVTDVQLAGICRSIVEFGFIDPLIARREDHLVIGGHQRLKAVEKLLSGPFSYKGKDGKTVKVDWQLPEKGIPVIYLSGVDDTRAKMLNLALNRATGDWDHDQLATLLNQLVTEAEVDIHELTATAFSPAEITDYIDIATAPEVPDFSEGQMPTPSVKAPSVSLDFSSAELRDAVKSAIGAKAEAGELAGDTLARMLSVTADMAPKPRRRNAS